MLHMFVRLATALALTLPALAEEIEFDFKDPKGVNSMSFLLDSELEPIRGVATGVSGKLTFNPDKPEATSGQVTVASKTVMTSNPKMAEILHNPDWLDVEKHPEITFVFKEIAAAQRKGDNKFEMQVTGDFTCRGVTKSLTVPVSLTLLRDKLKERLQGKEGDLLVLRTEFTIQRKDFGIKPEYGPQVVAEDILIRAQIVGTHPK